MFHLTQLCRLMAKELARTMPINLSAATGARQTGLAKPVERLDLSARGKTVVDAYQGPKYYGAMKHVLERHETIWGFSMPKLWGLPAQTVLTGFVHPESFEQLLLAQARHWKDPGTTLEHGEYTHRLQWWIICRETELRGPYALKGAPVDRFKQVAKYRSLFWRDRVLKELKMAPEDAEGLPGLTRRELERTLWDYLFDAVQPGNERGGGTAVTTTFRSPQVLNLYLTSADVVKQHPGVLLLHCYLVHRYNKRATQRAIGEAFSTKAVLCSKWGISAEQFDAMFANEARYGKVEGDAVGRIATLPQ